MNVPLPLVVKNGGLALEDALPAVLARRVNERSMLAVCLEWRRMGIAKLFMSGLPGELFADLSRSARAFQFFLEGREDADKRTSRAEPFFDAIACGDRDAAAAIARHARATWNEGKEYEDDFLHVRFLMRLATAQPAPGELDALLVRWEEVLDGGDDPRLDLARALLARDQAAFDDALEEVVERRRAEVAEQLENERLLPEDQQTVAKLWVELLALLRVAEDVGLATPAELAFAPSLARRLDLARLPGPDDWKTVRSHRELS